MKSEYISLQACQYGIYFGYKSKRDNEKISLNSYFVVLIIKPTICTNFLNLFWNETLHVSNSSSVHHQEFFTVHTAMVYVIQVCRHIPLLCV